MAEQASTDAALTVLVAPGRQLTVTASASTIQGAESVFARIEVDTMRPSEPERHVARFALIGPRATVLDVLGRLTAARGRRPGRRRDALSALPRPPKGPETRALLPFRDWTAAGRHRPGICGFHNFDRNLRVIVHLSSWTFGSVSASYVLPFTRISLSSCGF